MAVKKQKLPLVYLASPYTLGNKELNLLAHFQTWRTLKDTGLMVPFAPLCNESMERVIELTEDEAFVIDFAILDRCDAILAFDAVVPLSGRMTYVETTSSGREREVARALVNGTPVFRDYAENNINSSGKPCLHGRGTAELIVWAIQWIRENN